MNANQKATFMLELLSTIYLYMYVYRVDGSQHFMMSRMMRWNTGLLSKSASRLQVTEWHNSTKRQLLQLQHVLPNCQLILITSAYQNIQHFH